MRMPVLSTQCPAGMEEVQMALAGDKAALGLNLKTSENASCAKQFYDSVKCVKCK